MVSSNINKELLKKILDDQYQHCLDNIISEVERKVQKLDEYGGNALDIRTEILIGHSMEDTICHQWYSDYYDKDKILGISVPTEAQKGPYISQESYPVGPISEEQVRRIVREELKKLRYLA